MDQVIESLNALSYKTRNVLSLLDISPGEMQILVENIVLVRRLLTQWKNAETSLERNSRRAESINDLITKYFELEGMAKERRNGLIGK